MAATLAVADDGRPPMELIGWKAAWSVPAADDAALSFLSGESLLTATTEGTVTVRDRDTGAIRRTIRNPVPSVHGAWTTTTTLIVAGSPKWSSDQTLYSYDLASGSPLWQYKLPPSGPKEDNLPWILVAEYGAFVFQPRSGLLALDVRTGRVHARATDAAGCEGHPGSTPAAVLLLSHCGQGRVRLDSLDPRTLRRNWTRLVTTRYTAADDDAWFGYEHAPNGFIVVDAADERFLFAEDGTPLPISHLPAGDGRWRPPVEVGDHPDADPDTTWPLPSFLISRDWDTGRLGSVPLDRQLSTGTLVGATPHLALIHSDAQITAFHPVYGRPSGPIALGGVPPGDWPDACSLLTPGDVSPGVRRLPGHKSLGRLALPNPVTCDWVPPEDDHGVVSLSVQWVSPNADALFAATIEQTKKDENYDYDPTTEREGIFSYTFHGSGGDYGATLVNVGPVIVHLTSPSRLVQRLAAIRVRDNLMARDRPGERLPRPAWTGGWTHVADKGVRANVAVDGGAVYISVTDGAYSMDASARAGLYALDAVTGRTLWRSLPAAPMLVDGMLYGVRDDGVAAVNAATGRIRWRRDIHEPRDITIHDGSVYFGDGTGRAYALSAATGKQRWRFRVSGSLGRVAVAADTVYVSSQEGHWDNQENLLSAFDAQTGVLRWRSRLGADNLTATSETVFAVAGTRVAALDPTTGRARWRARFGDIIRGDPVVIGDTVYLGDLAGRTYALDAASGKERWRLTTAGDSFSWSVAESHGVVYVGGQDLHALDPASGKERWSKPLTAKVSVHEDTVFAQDEVGTLHALDAATGAPRWRFQTGSHFQTVPIVAGGLVYVGGSNGNLYALRAMDGLPGPSPAELTMRQ
ncbi:PQQ-binding-like beta-propeller repeat protein [Nonomuraea bangladeshensis]|uniref:outer membrane protein assembly factor BamB family protein n=1 Tax=Nonomuraea bangladeshensis TaxID=404385 RepID=UPI003C2B99B4